MQRAFCHTISQRKCARPAEIHKKNFCCLWQRYDFHLFLDLKEHLAGKTFDDDDQVQEEVMTWFKWQAADFYDSGIQKLIPRLNK
jgi:hypothetical protein